MARRTPKRPALTAIVVLLGQVRSKPRLLNTPGTTTPTHPPGRTRVTLATPWLGVPPNAVARPQYPGSTLVPSMRRQIWKRVEGLRAAIRAGLARRYPGPVGRHSVERTRAETLSVCYSRVRSRSLSRATTNSTIKPRVRTSWHPSNINPLGPYSATRQAMLVFLPRPSHHHGFTSSSTAVWALSFRRNTRICQWGRCFTLCHSRYNQVDPRRRCSRRLYGTSIHLSFLRVGNPPA